MMGVGMFVAMLGSDSLTTTSFIKIESISKWCAAQRVAHAINELINYPISVFSLRCHFDFTSMSLRFPEWVGVEGGGGGVVALDVLRS